MRAHTRESIKNSQMLEYVKGKSLYHGIGDADGVIWLGMQQGWDELLWAGVL